MDDGRIDHHKWDVAQRCKRHNDNDCCKQSGQYQLRGLIVSHWFLLFQMKADVMFSVSLFFSFANKRNINFISLHLAPLMVKSHHAIGFSKI